MAALLCILSPMKTTSLRAGSLRARVRFWFEDLSTPMGRAVDLAVLVLIIVGCVNAVALTYWDESTTLKTFDGVVTALFIGEYVLRLWSAERPLRHIFKLYSLIDIVAIIPTQVFGLRGLRIFRLLRVLRLIRFLEKRTFFFGTIRQTHLYVIRLAFTLFCIPFVSAGLIYYAERSTAPERQFGDFSTPFTTAW